MKIEIKLRGIQDRSSLQMYWASGVHVYTPLPFLAGRGGGAGGGGGGGLGDLFRSHLFLNAGCLAMPGG